MWKSQDLLNVGVPGVPARVRLFGASVEDGAAAQRPLLGRGPLEIVSRYAGGERCHLHYGAQSPGAGEGLGTKTSSLIVGDATISARLAR